MSDTTLEIYIISIVIGFTARKRRKSIFAMLRGGLGEKGGVEDEEEDETKDDVTVDDVRKWLVKNPTREVGGIHRPKYLILLHYTESVVLESYAKPNLGCLTTDFRLRLLVLV